MSSTLYNKAFEVELMHNFYVYTNAPLNNKFKVNRDMKIVPTKECAELMRRGRMRFVPTMKGFTTFYQAYINPSNAQEQLVTLNDFSEFVFSLHMDVASVEMFLNVSNLDVGSKTYAAGMFFMLNQKIQTSTANPPQTLTYTATLANSLRASIFGYSFKRGTAYTGAADIKVRAGSISGPIVQTIVGIARNTITDTYSAEIDLSKQPKGFYVLEAYETGTATVINSDDFYVDGDLLGQNTFGIMRVVYEDISKLYLTTTGKTKFYTFDYTFGVRSVKWRYYIVGENLDNTFFSTYDLKVIKEGGAYIFYASYPPLSGVPFAQPNGKPDTTVPVNGKKTVVFQSTTDIPFSEEAQLDFNLYKKAISGGVETKMISNLANAKVNGVDSDQWGPFQTPPSLSSDILEIYVFV